MNRFRHHLTPLITSVIVLSLSSCSALSVSSQNDSTHFPAAETLKSLAGSTDSVASGIELNTQPSLDVLASTLSPSSKPKSLNITNTKAIPTAKSSNAVTLHIYHADSQCRNLVPEQEAVPATNPIDAAVGRVLKQVDSGDFDLAGYRVKVNAGIATVDLRRMPNSRRQFVSLSECEQFALFGSLRKTLTTNSQLKIKAVRFTEQGQAIKF